MATKSEPRLHEEESKIPVFTVIKNGSILKNIFIVNNSQKRLPFISPLKPVSSVQQPDREFEEILIVGRHPDCNVMLTHPSISRFHLQIASNQSLQKFSVIDLSSVHGTWVSGKKIDPGVRVELNEGDTLRIGVSSRVYRLHWIPLSYAYDFESSYVSASDLSLMEEKASENAVIEENEMGDFQDENYFPVENKRIEEKNKLVVEMKEEVEEDQGKCEFAQCDNSTLVENKKIQPLDFLEGSLSPLLSNEDFGLMVKEEIPSAPPLPENPIFTLFDENDEGFESPFKDVEEQNEISSHCGGFYESELAKFSSPTKGVILGSENSECDEENHEGLELYCVADRVHHQATETPDKSEDQKISTKDHEQKDVLCEYSATAATESVNSSLPMGEVVSECQTPESLSAAGRLSQTEIVDNPPIKSDQRSSCGSIWSRRGKPASIQLRLGGSKGGASLAGVGFEDEQHNKENAEDKSVSKALFCTPDKENFTPNTLLLKSLKKKGKLVEEKHSKPDRSSVSKVTFSPNIHPEDLIASSDKEEIFTPDKENITPNTLLLKSLKKKGKLKEVKHSKSRRLLSSKVTSSTNIRSEKDLIASSVKEEIITLDKENITPNTLPPRSLKKKGKLEEVKHSKSGLFSSEEYLSRPNIFPPEEWPVNSDKEENFTPDKENITPNTLLLKSLQKKGRLESLKHPYLCGSSSPKFTTTIDIPPKEDTIALSDKESDSCGVLQELDFPKQPISSNQVMLEEESMINKRRPERVPFQTLLENSAGKSRSETLAPSSATRSSASINYTQIMEKKNQSAREGTRSWTMVVDSATLLDKESRKLLQLLQGLKGTRLIIPRMVVRELDCLKRRGSLFRRNTEASLVLEWIEQCMADTTWWIHVQSSVEDGRLTAATPPATPTFSFSNGIGEFPFGTTSSMPFLSFSSLMEIASPSTEDHILDCALLCKTMKTDGQLVLLSNDITLKIKAMAEGLICETVQEFRNSLMNPFSERFLWADSSPRGRTWSVLDDVVLRERYNRCPLRRGESAKGLKLILLHNSHYRQMSPIS